MTLVGIKLRQPTFGRLILCLSLATLAWFFSYFLVHYVLGLPPIAPIQAGAWLVVLGWGMLSEELGICVRQGINHVAVLAISTACIVCAYMAVALSYLHSGSI